MQLRLVNAAGETRQLDEIVNAFTPPMTRVCRHMPDAALRAMIERMALHKLAEEQRRAAGPRRAATSRRRPAHRTSAPLQIC
jgi:hypothetical protein